MKYHPPIVHTQSPNQAGYTYSTKLVQQPQKYGLFVLAIKF